MLRTGFEWYGELGTYVREDYPSRLLCSHIGCIGCELLSNKYGELVTYVRKDYLSVLLGSHMGYIGCELSLND